MPRRRMKQRAALKNAASAPDRWDLTGLIRNPDEEYDLIIKDLDSQVSRFETFRERLSAEISASTFQEILQLNEEIANASSRLSAYAYLWFSESTQNPQARAFKSKTEERLTSLQNRMLFFDIWWQKVDDANAARLLTASGDQRYHLESIRRFKPHTLSEPEEKIVNLKNVTGRTAVNTLYDVLTNSLSFHLRVNGQKKAMTREELTVYLHSPRRGVRRSAYRELLRVFAGQRDLIGEMYLSLVHDWKNENLDMRKFPSSIGTRNLSNDVPDEAIDALLSVCRRNTPVFQEYFRLKSRICKIPRMSRYDLYAPHHAERKTYRYQDAVRMVLDAYRGFSPQLAELAQRVFDDRHIDAKPQAGKMTGAYCYSLTPTATPYVFLNYTGEARDIATLAHELGHAVHSMVARDHSIFTFHATLPLAETASVFGERVLSDALMAQETNKAVKQGLLLAQLDDIYATVVRQAYFVLFEQEAHELIARGATVQDLARSYLHGLRQQFGKALAVPEEFQWEWLSIPHVFASPFYCYAYSFGNLLVLALYRMFKEQGPAFVPQYVGLLAAGGSQSPSAILSEVGVDIRSEEFWQSGFDTIAGMVKELERTMR